MNKLRVGFPLISSRAWMGGYNYLLNLVSALARYESERIEPVIFCGDDTPGSEIQPFMTINGISVVRHPGFSPTARRRGLMQAILLGTDRMAVSAFNTHHIDVIFESARFFGWRLPQASIAWLPDFQHRHMPHLFKRAAWWHRELGFQTQVLTGRTLLLSSEDARRDCERFYPLSAGRTMVLHFPAMPDSASLAGNPDEIRRLYGLPDRFVYLPNQFWRHKNHEVVIEALGILRQRGESIAVVASGNTHDPRDPGHFNKLQSRARELGIDNTFLVLGTIPRDHVLSLLRTCSAMLNPSLFEGWNTGVEEAKSLGVPMLLSDIGVHHEQAGDTAAFFPPHEPEALAKLLQKINSSGAPVTPRVPVTDAEAASRAFAAEFANIVRLAQNTRK